MGEGWVDGHPWRLVRVNFALFLAAAAATVATAAAAAGAASTCPAARPHLACFGLYYAHLMMSSFFLVGTFADTKKTIA